MIRDLNERAQYIDLKQKQLVAMINKIRTNAKTGTGSTSISIGLGENKTIYAGKLEQFTKDGFSVETTEKKGKKKKADDKPKEKPKS